MRRTTAETATDIVAANIRAELARRGIRSHEMADRLGWTPAKLSRRLTGRTRLTIDDTAHICSELGISPADLYSGVAA